MHRLYDIRSLEESTSNSHMPMLKVHVLTLCFQAIVAAQPEFTSRSTITPEQYACDLLSELNDNPRDQQVRAIRH